MILLKDQIRYERVLSKRCEFYYKDLGKNLTQFLDEVKEIGGTPNGPVFYSLNNVPMDECMKVEFFLPVKEELDGSDGIYFHSYYSVEQMMSMRILENFEEKVQEAYSAMYQFLNAQNMEQVTPIYHVFEKVDKRPFVIIKMGYRRKES